MSRRYEIFMPKIVILGSLAQGDYKVTYPIKETDYYTKHEDAYLRAREKFYRAIDESDVIIVIGTRMGEHTRKDIQYAKSKNKKVVFVMIEDEEITVPVLGIRN